MEGEAESKLKLEMTKEYGKDVFEYYGESRPDYLVLNMSILEEMPKETQRLIVSVLENVHDTFDMSEAPDSYQVNARGPNGNSKGGSCIIKDIYKKKSPPKWRK